MAIGQKMGSLKNLKQSMAKGGGAFIKFVPKNGSLNVRFIEEPEEWVNYSEHWDAMLRKSYPCTEDASCPGCVNGDRKSSRYLANAIDVDETDPQKKGKVLPLQLPKDLANRLVIKYEKWGTLVDRDIELSRSGDGLDTVYDLDAGVKDPINLGQFQPLDLLKVLQDAYESVFGAGTAAAAQDDDDDDGLPPPTPKPRKRSAAAAVARGEVAEDDEAEDEAEEAEPAPKPAKKSPAKKAPAKKAAAKPEPEFEPDVDDDEDNDPEPDEPEVDADEADDDDWTEEALLALPLGALRRVAREDFGVDPKGMNQEQIIDAIFEVGGVDEDDEGPDF